MKTARFPLLRFAAPLALGLLLLAGLLSARAQDPSLRFGGQIPPDVDTIYDRGLTFLAAAQAPDGAWHGPNEGAGVTGICLMAFLASGEDPNYGRYAVTIRRAIRSIIQSQDATTGYFPSSMYHLGFGLLALSESYGVVDESLLWQGDKPVRTIAQAIDLGIRCASTAQKKNKFGGWRYSPDATDADTSVTGAVLMGLLAARNAGMDVPDDVVNSAMEFERRSTGTDGSVAYTGGFGAMGGSMNLTAGGDAGRRGFEIEGNRPIQVEPEAPARQSRVSRERQLCRIFPLLHGAGPLPGRLRRVAKVERGKNPGTQDHAEGRRLLRRKL